MITTIIIFFQRRCPGNKKVGASLAIATGQFRDGGVERQAGVLHGGVPRHGVLQVLVCLLKAPEAVEDLIEEQSEGGKGERRRGGGQPACCHSIRVVAKAPTGPPHLSTVVVGNRHFRIELQGHIIVLDCQRKRDKAVMAEPVVGLRIEDQSTTAARRTSIATNATQRQR